MSMRTSSAHICGDVSRRSAAWGSVIWSPEGSRTRCRPTGELSGRTAGILTGSSWFRVQVGRSCGGVTPTPQVLPYHVNYAHKDRAALRLHAPRAGGARLD